MELCAEVAKLAGSPEVAKDFSLRDQLRNSARAAPALIAEGFLRFTAEEFVRYLRMARGELGELQTHLEAAAQQGHVSGEQLSRLMSLANQAMAVTTNLLKSKLPQLKRKGPAGPRRS